MNDDAFDDVQCPFNYHSELMKAREALNKTIGRFALDNPRMGYRELAKTFRISPGKLCAIAKRCKLGRTPGPRSGRTTVMFVVRYREGQHRFEATVRVVTAREGISAELMRRSLTHYYKTSDVSVGSGRKTDRRVEYDYDEHEALNTPLRNLRKL